jgi:hypothetical protein
MLTAAQAAFTALYSVLREPYSAVAAFSVAVRAPAYFVVEVIYVMYVMYVVSALYQIWTVLSRPMPVPVEPFDVGEF